MFSFGTPACAKALDDVTLHTPRHGTDEAFRRRRRKRRADLQQLRYERRIVRNPVAHHDAAAGFRNAHHLLRDIEGLGRKHRAKHGDGHIKRIVGDAFQIARVSFLKLQPAETRFRGPFVPGFDEVPGDVDSRNFRPVRASGIAVVPSPQPRSKTRSGGVIPGIPATASPD